MKTVKCIINGVGGVGRILLEELNARRQRLRERYQIDVAGVGVADSRGCHFDVKGVDAEAVLRVKKEGLSVSSLPGSSSTEQDMLDVLHGERIDVMFEAGPTLFDERHESSLRFSLKCIERGVHIVY